MTVGELIEELKKQNPAHRVVASAELTDGGDDYLGMPVYAVVDGDDVDGFKIDGIVALRYRTFGELGEADPYE